LAAWRQWGVLSQRISYQKWKVCRCTHPPALCHRLNKGAVIHFIASPEIAKQDLPALLSGKKPSHASGDGIGSQDYSKQPQAIVSGLGYTNEVLDEIRQSCAGVGAVPWIRGGLSKARFEDMMKNEPLMPPSEQGPISALKAKKVVLDVINSGNGGKDGVFEWW
jgi:hypothetical protein